VAGVPDTTARLLRLLSLLQTHRFWTGTELTERLAVSERTLRRDVERLRELDYPVQASRGTGGGYWLEAGAAMPPLVLDDDEAVAVAVGLRTAAGAGVTGVGEASVRALAKLEQVLPARLRPQVAALAGATSPLVGPAPTVAPDTLAVLARAVRDRERVRFDYRRRDGSTGSRLAEPHGLVPSGRRWYLVAWDVARDDWRTFRLDRLAAPRPTGERVPPRELPGGDAALVARSIERTVARHRAVVTLHAAPAVVLDRLGTWPEAEVEPVGPDACRLRTHADSLETLAVLVAQLDVDFTVDEPPELADHVRRIAARWARAAGPGGPAPPVGPGVTPPSA
jgi:predicted DNA-binding transcriptional regulator YafY